MTVVGPTVPMPVTEGLPGLRGHSRSMKDRWADSCQCQHSFAEWKCRLTCRQRRQAGEQAGEQASSVAALWRVGVLTSWPAGAGALQGQARRPALREGCFAEVQPLGVERMRSSEHSTHATTPQASRQVQPNRLLPSLDQTSAPGGDCCV